MMINILLLVFVIYLPLVHNMIHHCKWKSLFLRKSLDQKGKSRHELYPRGNPTLSSQVVISKDCGALPKENYPVAAVKFKHAGVGSACTREADNVDNPFSVEMDRSGKGSSSRMTAVGNVLMMGVNAHRMKILKKWTECGSEGKFCGKKL